MNEGLFQAQINEIEGVLNRHDLLFERNYFPNYQRCTATRFRNKSYREIWEICINEKYYHFVLPDHSLLQFRADITTPKYCYVFYETPYYAISYADFLIQDCGFSKEDLIGIGDIFKQDYEIFLATSDLKKMVTPVRYDYDQKLYKEARHPASHIHLGHDNNIRIGTKKILRPLSFLEFVLRQYYPEKWIEFLKLDNGYFLCRNVRENLDDVDNEFSNPLDEWEMKLH